MGILITKNASSTDSHAGHPTALNRASSTAAAGQREREVLEQLLHGHCNKNIGDHLGITPRTVEFYRANIVEKMGVNSAVELAHRMGRFCLT
jgi:two-component system response regulator DctR